MTSEFNIIQQADPMLGLSLTEDGTVVVIRNGDKQVVAEHIRSGSDVNGLLVVAVAQLLDEMDDMKRFISDLMASNAQLNVIIHALEEQNHEPS